MADDDRTMLVTPRIADLAAPMPFPTRRVPCAACRALCSPSVAGLESVAEPFDVICTRCAPAAADADRHAHGFTTPEVRALATEHGAPPELVDFVASLPPSVATRLIGGHE